MKDTHVFKKYKINLGANVAAGIYGSRTACRWSSEAYKRKFYKNYKNY